MADYCSSNNDDNKQTDGEDNGSKINKTLKSLQFSNPGAKFSGEASGKRKIKSTNRFDVNFLQPVYNEKGVFIATNQDLCDCLKPECPGCHFPCPQCKSCKCGSKCRVNRCWYYESVETEGLELEYRFDPEKNKNTEKH